MKINNQTTSIKEATIINFLGKYTHVIIQIIYGAILSRILGPEDFGIVAVVTVFTSLFTLIANMGIGPAIIQNTDINDNDINSLFSVTIYIGLIMSLFFAFFSGPISIFYSNTVYIPIGILLSFSLFFNTLNIVPNAVLLKNHKFRTVNLRLVIVSISSAILTIALALVGFKYYALVLHSILVSLFTFIWNMVTVKPKFTRSDNRKSFDKIRDFSSYQFAFSIINYLSRNMDNLLIGRFLGNEALGFYDKSYRLMLYPVQNLTHVITPVLHPILSLHQDDKEYIFVRYIRVVKLLSLIAVFVTAYSFFSSEEIIILLYGNQWYESIGSFRILALSIWAQMVTSSTGAIFQSIGDTKLLFRTGSYSAVLIVSSIFLGVFIGDINTVAITVTIAYNLNFFMSFYMLVVKGFGKRSFTNFIQLFIPDIFVFFLVFFSLFLTNKLEFDNLLLSAIIKLLFGVISYITAIVITKQHKYLLPFFKK
ncbi:polysaccharide transporter, PST family [Alkalibacterium putridalgicola]|uniref:Lipopolysaccharide biosynthesis protein n=1 Tax=Alkalibacterium putridalgicola TaxID=426703 RepID=A0A1H7QQI1_9LACT|nr:lipopolysaccharide biosynthesis protein [Alkalibacterium putridalgicola]GEK88386.1 lipopolysaccharide biosynthesis protein [Alkalibacterium putridalgicola]SEL49865.1 polysaccharide transporter, PST family [Alkalibacterium putridalgicola]